MIEISIEADSLRGGRFPVTGVTYQTRGRRHHTQKWGNYHHGLRTENKDQKEYPPSTDNRCACHKIVTMEGARKYRCVTPCENLQVFPKGA